MYKRQHKITPLLWYGNPAGDASGRCSWLKHRFGLSWQIEPKVPLQMMSDRDSARVARVMQAMMKMSKFDIAALRRACDGA